MRCNCSDLLNFSSRECLIAITNWSFPDRFIANAPLFDLLSESARRLVAYLCTRNCPFVSSQLVADSPCPISLSFFMNEKFSLVSADRVICLLHRLFALPHSLTFSVFYYSFLAFFFLFGKFSNWAQTKKASARTRAINENKCLKLDLSFTKRNI